MGEIFSLFESSSKTSDSMNDKKEHLFSNECLLKLSESRHPFLASSSNDDSTINIGFVLSFCNAFV